VFAIVSRRPRKICENATGSPANRLIQVNVGFIRKDALFVFIIGVGWQPSLGMPRLIATVSENCAMSPICSST